MNPNSWDPEPGSGSLNVFHPAIARWLVRHPRVCYWLLRILNRVE
jgi:hypothetical protein